MVVAPLAWMLCCGLGAALASQSPAPQKRLLVLPIHAGPGVQASTAVVLTDYLDAQARRIPGYAVVTQKDLEQMLSVEMKKQLTGCSDRGCLAELGGALNAEEILYGNVGKLGPQELVLTLTRLDAKSSAALGGQSERLSGAQDALVLDHLGLLLQRLYPDYAPPPAKSSGVGAVLSLLAMGVLGITVQYAAMASVVASLVFSGFFPLQVTVFLISACALLAAPGYVAWMQAYALDLLAKRRVGWRWAALTGLGLMAVSGVVIGTPLTLGAAVAVASAAVSTLLALVAAGPSQAALGPRTLLGGVGAGLGLALVGVIPGLLFMVVGVPLIQAALLYWKSQPRPVDADAEWPGLYAPWEPRPSWTPRLPGILDRVWGGNPAEDPSAHPATASSAAEPPAAAGQK